MNKAARVYQKRLNELGYGLPLWRPEPTPWEVLIGDVGRIDPEDGSWDRFFNILHPRGSPVNVRGVPDSFPVLLNTPNVKVSPGQLKPQVYSSETIRSQIVKAEGSAGINGLEGSLITQYECANSSGALLALQDDGNQETVPHNKHWVEYMKRHHESWHRWAIDKCGIIVDKEDIVLVRGWIKTRRWALGSFQDQGQVMEFSLKGITPYGGIGLSFSQSTQHKRCPESRWSTSFYTHSDRVSDTVPSPPTDCIFVSLYRARYRSRKFLTIKAAAEPMEPSEDEDHYADGEALVHRTSDEEMEVTLEPEHHKARLPVDRILDYLLASTNADVAIAPDPFTFPETGKPVKIDELSEEEIRQKLPCTVTANGAVTVQFEALGNDAIFLSKTELSMLVDLEAQLCQDLSSVSGIRYPPFEIDGPVKRTSDIMNLCIKAIEILLLQLKPLTNQSSTSDSLSRLDIIQEALQPLSNSCRTGIEHREEIGREYIEILQDQAESGHHPLNAAIGINTINFLRAVNKFSDFFDYLSEKVDSLRRVITDNELKDNEIGSFRSQLEGQLHALSIFSSQHRQQTMSGDKVALCIMKRLEIKLRDDLLFLNVSRQSEPFRIEGPIPTPTDLVKLCSTTANWFQGYVETIRYDNISNQTLSQLSKQRMELQSHNRQCKEAIQSFRKLGDSYASTLERQAQRDLVEVMQEFLGVINVLSDFFDQLNEWLTNIESWISEGDFRDEDIAPLKEWLHDEVQAFEAY